MNKTIIIHQEIINQANAEQLKIEAMNLLNEDIDHLILDLSETSRVSSTGMAVFLYLYKYARNLDKELSIINASKEIYNLLSSLKITEIIDVKRKTRSYGEYCRQT